jgi:hypothetical protein
MQIFVKTLTGKTTSLRPGGCISDQFPTRGTRFRLTRQVSASHDKSLPRTASPAPTSAWAQTHDSGIATDADGGANLHVTREQQLAAMQTTCPGKSLNAGLTSCSTITSPSSPTLPHARLNPRHSSTLYNAHEPRLRLGRGKLGKHSGRLRQAQNYSGRRPSVPEGTVQPGHAAVSLTMHRDSTSMHSDGRQRTAGRASCQAL